MTYVSNKTSKRESEVQYEKMSVILVEMYELKVKKRYLVESIKRIPLRHKHI